ARTVALRVKDALDGWSAATAQRSADARLWAAAQSDPRVMKDLQSVLRRSEAESLLAVGDELAPHLVMLNARARRLARMYTNQV
ncbi:MAG: hypothetical protein LH479_06425, partial [Polaromonas sp.]|nr:hypothetical protein [Polaromonas sp.]